MITQHIEYIQHQYKTTDMFDNLHTMHIGAGSIRNPFHTKLNHLVYKYSKLVFFSNLRK